MSNQLEDEKRQLAEAADAKVAAAQRAVDEAETAKKEAVAKLEADMCTQCIENIDKQNKIM